MRVGVRPAPPDPRSPEVLQQFVREEGFPCPASRDPIREPARMPALRWPVRRPACGASLLFSDLPRRGGASEGATAMAACKVAVRADAGRRRSEDDSARWLLRDLRCRVERVRPRPGLAAARPLPRDRSGPRHSVQALQHRARELSGRSGAGEKGAGLPAFVAGCSRSRLDGADSPGRRRPSVSDAR